MTDPRPAYEPYDDPAECLGELIQLRLATLGVSVVALRKMTGISASTMRRITSGTRTPTCATLSRICRALDVSADWLLGLSPRMGSAPPLRAGATDQRSVEEVAFRDHAAVDETDKSQAVAAAVEVHAAPLHPDAGPADHATDDATLQADADADYEPGWDDFEWPDEDEDEFLGR